MGGGLPDGVFGPETWIGNGAGSSSASFLAGLFSGAIGAAGGSGGSKGTEGTMGTKGTEAGNLGNAGKGAASKASNRLAAIGSAAGAFGVEGFVWPDGVFASLGGDMRACRIAAKKSSLTDGLGKSGAAPKEALGMETPLGLGTGIWAVIWRWWNARKVESARKFGPRGGRRLRLSWLLPPKLPPFPRS